MSEPLKARFSDGSRAETAAYADHILALRVERAYPPGRPLELSLERPDADPLGLSGRCIGSKKRPDGDFDVRLRMTNFTRDARLFLERHYG